MTCWVSFLAGGGIGAVLMALAIFTMHAYYHTGIPKEPDGPLR